MKLTELHFQRYLGNAYPRNHPTKPDKALEYPDVPHYAIPGGGVAMRPACELWGLHHGVKVTFQ